MSYQEALEREKFFTRRTRGLHWLEFVFVTAGMVLLILNNGPLAILGLVLSVTGAITNAWRNVQRFRLMDEYEQLILLKGVSVAFILLMSLLFAGGLAFTFLVQEADPQLIGIGLMLAFLTAHLVIGIHQSRLTQSTGASI